MSAIASCPQCGFQLAVPAEVQADSRVRCPVCRNDFFLNEVTISPVLEMILVPEPELPPPDSEPQAQEEGIEHIDHEIDEQSATPFEVEDYAPVDEVVPEGEAIEVQADGYDNLADVGEEALEQEPEQVVHEQAASDAYLPSEGSDEVESETEPFEENEASGAPSFETESESGVTSPEDGITAERDPGGFGAGILSPEEVLQEFPAPEPVEQVVEDVAPVEESPTEVPTETISFSARDTIHGLPSRATVADYQPVEDQQSELSQTDPQEVVAEQELQDATEPAEQPTLPAYGADPSWRSEDSPLLNESPPEQAENTADVAEFEIQQSVEELSEEPPVASEPWQLEQQQPLSEFPHEEQPIDEEHAAEPEPAEPVAAEVDETLPAEPENRQEETLALEAESQPLSENLPESEPLLQDFLDSAEVAPPEPEHAEPSFDMEQSGSEAEQAVAVPAESEDNRATLEMSESADFYQESADSPREIMLDYEEPSDEIGAEQQENLADETDVVAEIEVEDSQTDGEQEPDNSDPAGTQQTFLPGVGPEGSSKTSRSTRGLMSLLGMVGAGTLGLGALGFGGWMLWTNFFSGDTALKSTGGASAAMAQSESSTLPNEDKAVPPQESQTVQASYENEQPGASAVGDRYAEPTQPEPAEFNPAEDTAPLDAMLSPQVTGAPTYSLEQVSNALSNARRNQSQLIEASLDDPATRRAKADSYVAFCDLAEALTYVTDDRQGSESTLLLLESKDLFQDVLESTQMRQDIARLAGYWSRERSRPHNGIFTTGTLTKVQKKGNCYEYFLDSGVGDTVSVVLPERLDRSRVSKGVELVVVGSLVDEPASRISGYQGDSAQTIWATSLKPLDQAEPVQVKDIIKSIR